MSWLVDTNVVSELGRSRPDPGVLAWAEGVDRLVISAIALEEIQFGLASNQNQRRTQMFAQLLAERCDVLPVTAAIARHAGQLRGSLRGRGSVRTQADMLIAATAAVNGLTLVTRNARDFADTGIALLNPFLP